jgi:lysophospholipase L1-like esterase
MGLVVTDVSCSGATTANMTLDQQTAVGRNPPQLAAVRPADKVVTLQIGGNDIGFIGILENCVALTPSGPTKVGWDCKAHYTAGGTDLISVAIKAMAPKLAATLTDVHRLAPHARVFVIGYPAILPATGRGCWPQMPLTYRDVPYLRAVEVELDDTVARVAVAGRATYVDTYSAGSGHSVCAAEGSRWIEPLVPDSLAAPVHPNAAGEVAMAGFVTAAWRAAGNERA